MVTAPLRSSDTNDRPRRASRRAIGAAAAALALAAALIAALPALAQARSFRFRVVQATHRSAASGHDADAQFSGSARSSWHLKRATRKAPNVITVGYSSFLGVSGSGRMNLRGVYREQATLGDNNCSLVAPTGSRKYGLVSPGPDTLTVGGAPGKRATVTIGGLGGSMMATGLGNPYFGGPCEFPLHDPDNAQDRARTGHVPYAAFRKRKRIVIRIKGGYNAGDASAHWNTRIVLKRITHHKKRHHHRKRKHHKKRARH